MTAPESPTAAPSLANRPELPVHLTRFVGRDRELDDLVELAPTARLLTLTGAGGSGKTRLAREAALRLADRFDRVAWIDLTPLTQPESIALEAAAALRVPERVDASPLDMMIAAIGDRRTLLVLDNCEHLVDACAAMVEALLRACPGLTILATSREALAAESETAWLVPPLARTEATELFVERAREALPSFALTPATARTVEEICRRLDGIPLAIELAAARVRVLSPEQIARRLDDAFHLLSGRSRTALPRHRTLRATMEWSFDLLCAREQVLLRRLAVFAGSFTLDAAEAVCAGGGLDVDDILDGVTTLVDKSLVFMEPGEGDARYRLLETVRQYGVERLEEADERSDLERRYADHFLRFLERRAPDLIGGSNAPDVLAHTVAEMDNLRAAAIWSVGDADRAETALRFVGSGFWICYALGMFREMRQVTDHALALGHDGAPLARGRALVSSGLVALAQGEYDRSCADFEAALPLLREGGDEQAIAISLAKQGAARMLGGDLDGAVARLDEALEFTRGFAAHDPAVIFARFWRSWAAYGSGDLDLAHQLMEACVREGREHDLPTTRGHATAALGRIELARGRVDEARALAAEALEIEVAINDGWGIALALDVAASAAARLGHADAAVRIMAGTEAHRGRISLALPGPAPLERIAQLEELRPRVGARFDDLYAEGLALCTDDVVRLALDEVGTHRGRTDADLPDRPGPEVVANVGAATTPGARASTAPGAPGSPRLSVLALGPLRVAVDGRTLEPADWGSARPRELLVYLLMHPEGRTKEQVGLVFWPDASASQIRNNFHVTLHRLRKALGGSESVTLAGDRYRIDRAGVELDVDAFEREVTSARRALKRQTEGAAAALDASLARYRGDFLDGEPVGDWHLEDRDRLRRLYVEALMELGAHHVREARPERAAEAYRRVLARDDLHEAALRALILALDQTGERSQALRVYQRFAERLRRELGAQPERETVTLMERMAGVGA